MYRIYLFVLAMALASTSVQAQMRVWDNFSGRVLSTNKWENNWFSGDALTLKRRLAKGKLELAVSAKGNVLTDDGVTKARNRIQFPDRLAGNILAVESRMWLISGQASYCNRPAAEKNSRGRLRQSVSWFNDGSSTGPEDRTGDVQSYLSLRIVPGSVDRNPQVRFWAWRCLDANCDNVQDADISNSFLMNIAYKQPVKTTTTYNRQNNALIFSATAGRQTKRETIRLDSLGRPSAKPVGKFNVIEARAEVDNCLLGANGHNSRNRPFTSVEGRVDQVRIQQGRL